MLAHDTPRIPVLLFRHESKTAPSHNRHHCVVKHTQEALVTEKKPYRDLPLRLPMSPKEHLSPGTRPTRMSGSWERDRRGMRGV